MEVNDHFSAEVNPSPCRNASANILFVQGHVEFMVLKTITRTLAMTSDLQSTDISVKSWENEFLNALSGTIAPINVTDERVKSSEQMGLRRDPYMPLIWSVPGKFFADRTS